MAEIPEAAELDPQDVAETFDETHLDEDGAEFVTLEEMDDVFDATSALGDARDVTAADAGDLDPGSLDDEDLEEDEDEDERLDDDLEDRAEDDRDVDAEDVDEEDAVAQLQWDEADVEDVADVDPVTKPEDEKVEAYESDRLSDQDLSELGYRGQAEGAGEGVDKAGERPTGPHPDDVPDDANPHQDELLDEGVEETFPASDPVSVKRIT